MSKRTVLAAITTFTLAACGGASPHPLPGGASAITLGGGRGTSHAGGPGGQLTVASLGGGAVTVTPSGTLPAPWTWSYVAPSLGANPRTVSGALSLTPAGGAILGDDGATAATGLWVKPGAVLTLGPSDDADGIVGLDRANLSFPAGVVIEGTLQLGRANGGSSAASWSGTVAALAIRPGGRLIATGDAGTAAADGGAGGSIDLLVNGSCSNEGVIDTQGGRGRAGGAGGVINLVVSNGAVVNTGLANASGGEGLAGFGGDAGGVGIWGRWSDAGTGDFLGTGVVLARGGSGTAGGGAGGSGYFSGCLYGQAYGSGQFDVSGGDATGDGPGGAGSDLTVESSNGRTVVGGQLASHGGRGAGGGTGGSGGQITVRTNTDGTQAAGMEISTTVAAAFNLSGGIGAAGGGGGNLAILDDANATGSSGVTLIAQGALTAAGGDGAAGGGKGGGVAIHSDKGPDAVSTWRIGAVAVSLPVDASGGAATAGPGGAAGLVDLFTHRDLAANLNVPSATRRLTVGAAVKAAGGAGTTGGGAGGVIKLFEHVAVDATAPLDASGGAGGAGEGGLGGFVQAICDGVAHTGAIAADGGASTGNLGGKGGSVTLSSAGGPTVRSGVVSVRAGAGTSATANGVVQVDGTTPALTGGQLLP